MLIPLFKIQNNMHWKLDAHGPHNSPEQQLLQSTSLQSYPLLKDFLTAPKNLTNL